MPSGLFDVYPNLQIILGHLGEALPFLLPRLQHRLDEQRAGSVGSKAKQRVSYYFGSNLWVTTSGHFHTKQFRHAVDQVGNERVLFAVDYPYEQMDVAGRWFDDMAIPDEMKVKIGRENANELFALDLAALPNRAGAGFGS
jgi:gamma-resorcylate decarboxylase